MHQGRTHQYALFLATGKIEGSIKEDCTAAPLVKTSKVVPVCILSLHRKMMMTSAENYSENERKTVVAGEVKVQSVHRHNGARFGCKSAESAGIFV